LERKDVIESWFGLSPALFALATVAVIAAGVVRGYAGFGFSAIVVGALAIFMSPARIVPAMFILEIAASLSQLPAIRRHIDWSWLMPLAIANLITVPLGVWVLAGFDEVTLRILVGVSLLVLSTILLTGYSRPDSGRPVSASLRWTTGAISGVMTGVAAVGGLAVAAIFLLTGVAAAQLRATMVALLFVMDIWALGLSYAGGIVNWQTLTLAGVLVPAMIVGVHVGHRLFQRDMIRNAGQRAFRQRVSLLLFGLALAGLVRTLSTAYGG
jgi:uncharacterized membrane protein YfcA